jgi:hypothetical protein
VACVVVAHTAPPGKRLPRKVAGILFAVLLNFYGPNVLDLATARLHCGQPSALPWWSALAARLLW